MPLTLLIASAIVILACVGFVVVGTVYRWKVTSRGYQRWTEAVGVIAVLGLAAVAAWARRADLPLALGVGAGGVALAVVYVVMHRRMSARVAEMLGMPEEAQDQSNG